MNWKEELVKKINDLKPGDFVEGEAVVEVPFLVPWSRGTLFCEAKHCVNLYSVGWVGPGYLMLSTFRACRTPENLANGVLTFIVSRDRKYNEIVIEDVTTGPVTTRESPVFASIDFMSI